MPWITPRRGALLHAVDVLEVCGYRAKHRGAAPFLRDLSVPREQAITLKRSTLLIPQGTRFQGPASIFLTRAGVHQLLIASTKPESKEFREWLAAEVVVLPQGHLDRESPTDS